MTYARINDTIPHTWIVWDMHKESHSHITIQEIGVVRSPSCIENFHIFLEGLRKHFLYVCLVMKAPLSNTKLKTFLQNCNSNQNFLMDYRGGGDGELQLGAIWHRSLYFPNSTYVNISS